MANIEQSVKNKTEKEINFETLWTNQNKIW